MAIDTGIVAELVTLTQTLLGLFTSFPLNVILIGSLGTIGFKWFRKAKRAAQ